MGGCYNEKDPRKQSKTSKMMVFQIFLRKIFVQKLIITFQSVLPLNATLFRLGLGFLSEIIKLKVRDGKINVYSPDLFFCPDSFCYWAYNFSARKRTRYFLHSNLLYHNTICNWGIKNATPTGYFSLTVFDGAQIFSFNNEIYSVAPEVRG